MPTTPSLPSISYQHVGESGPRVLLLMGFGMRGEVWKPQIDGLQNDCQLIHFDNRGIGQSDEVGEAISMRDMATDAARVLDAVGWSEEVHVVGVSMGGMIAQELALLTPDRVASLTLVATHAGGPNAWLPPPKGIVHFLATHVGPAEKRAQAMAKLLYPKRFLREVDNQALKERMHFQMAPRPRRETLRKQLAAIRRHDTRKRLEKLRMPTLIIKPERDILVSPRHSDRLKEGIKHAKVMKLPEAGHGLIFQCAEKVNQRLLEHFASATASTPE